MIISELLHLILAVFLSFFLYPVWIDFVYKYNMGEGIREEGPKTHYSKKGTPTMGGFVFISVVGILTIALNISKTQTLFPLFVALMSGMFGIIEDFTKIYSRSSLSLLFRRIYRLGGILHLRFLNTIRNIFSRFFRFLENIAYVLGSEDKTGLRTYQKFMIQGAIGGFVSYWSYYKLGWDYIWLPLIGNANIGFVYPIIIFFYFMLLLNFVAFTDGLDGLAGGLGLIAFAALWVISSQLNYNQLSLFSATFVGALLPFLYFNVYPARIFMGNVGSHVLGATIAVLGVVMHREIAVLLISLVFIVDGFSSPLQQLSAKFTGKKIFRMAPLHHHFELMGWHETKITFRFWIFGALAAFLGILVSLL